MLQLMPCEANVAHFLAFVCAVRDVPRVFAPLRCCGRPELRCRFHKPYKPSVVQGQLYVLHFGSRRSVLSIYGGLLRYEYVVQ